jgi:LysM repeat protein
MARHGLTPARPSRVLSPWNACPSELSRYTRLPATVPPLYYRRAARRQSGLPGGAYPSESALSAKTFLTLTTLALTGALLVTACGGGGGGAGGAPSPGKIPTATALAVLPEPTILSGGTPVTGGGSGDTYVVKSGDTLMAIADKLGVPVEELISLNKLADPSHLEVDQILKVPTRSGTQPTPTPGGRPTAQATRAAPAGGETYEVQAGDNASDIAARFGITIQELAEANNMTIDELRTLFVGQVLTIPQFAGRTPVPTSTPEPKPTEAPTEAPTKTPQTVEATPTPVGGTGGAVETATPQGGGG